MNDDLERKYRVSPLPTAAEVLAGQTQGGVAAPSGFFTSEDLAVSPPGAGDAATQLRAARAELEAANQALVVAEERSRRAMDNVSQAERAFNDAVRREHGL